MKKLLIQMSIVVLLALFIQSCADDGNGFGNDTFEGVVANGGGFPSPEIEESSTQINEFEEDRDGSGWICKVERVSIKDGAGGNEGFPLYSPNASVIYPGNMLQGGSLQNATPDLIVVERAGGTISTDVVDGNISPSFEVNSITKSEVTVAVNNIIANSTGIVPANFSLSIQNIQSREQFALALGLNVNSTFVDIEADLNYSSDEQKNSFIVSLTQSFYTMSFDLPTSLDKLFAPSVRPQDLERYIGPGNPATYISDVTYGRVYYMMVQSTSSATEMSAALNASYNSLAVQVDGSLEVDYMSELDNLEISVFAYGGNSSSTLQTTGVIDVNELATLLAEAADIRSGKPVSYVVRSVYDNKIVSTQLATSYDQTTCTPNGANGAPPYTEHWTGEVVSRMGPVGAAFSLSGTDFVLINKDADKYMISKVGVLEGPFEIAELANGTAPPFEIGAACNIQGNGTEYGNSPFIQIFDKSGTQYHYLGWESRNYLNGDPNPITDLLHDGAGPFDGTGIGAAAFLHLTNTPSECCPSSRYYFNRQGTKYAYYQNNPVSFGNAYDLYYWGPNGSVTSRINEVGAAIGFRLSGLEYFILFNGAGTKYVYYGHIDGELSTIGPFDL